MRTSTHPVQFDKGNLLAMSDAGISEIISMLYAVSRDVNHAMFCPLAEIVSGNEHWQLETARITRSSAMAWCMGNISFARRE
ncbi:MAG TPA: hypothetical protein VGG62_17890 [Terracidiphilus sp.]|jgi:hypothetical protein